MYKFYDNLAKKCCVLSKESDDLSIIFRQKFLYGANSHRRSVSKEFPLNKHEKGSIKKHWQNIKIHDFWFNWYKKACIIREESGIDTDYSNIIWKYIPDDIFFMFFCGHYNDIKGCGGIDDKNLYDFYFHDIIQPKTLLRKVKGCFLDPNFCTMNDDDVINIIKKEESVVLKPAKDSSGGKGLLFLESNITDGMLKQVLNERDGYIVQKVIKQHSVLSGIHKESINTIRITTFYFHGKVIFLSAVLRMGVGGGNVDNASMGGLFCGIEQSGRLKKYGYDKKMNVTIKHPTSGIMFSEIDIPGFDKCKQMAMKLAYRFVEVSRLSSWDIAIGEDGDPVLIECNLRFGGIGFHQIANGPLFGDMTEDVMEDVFSKKSTIKYNKLFY